MLALVRFYEQRTGAYPGGWKLSRLNTSNSTASTCVKVPESTG